LQKEIKFAVEEIKQIEFSDYDEQEYAIARLGFISTKPNSHGIGIGEDVLRASSPSALGKWIVADVQFGDATTHTDGEYIVGIVPQDQEVVFEEDVDGYLRAYVDGIISKRYAAEFYDIFSEQDNERAVSIEARFEFADENDEDASAFDIKGITVLGKNVRPSCPDSDIELVRFSESDAEGYYKKIHGQLDSKFDGKEEKMEEKNIEMAEVEQTEVVEEPTVEMAEPEKQDGEMACDEKLEEEKPDGEESEEPDDKGEEKMSEDEMMAKINQLSKDVEDRDHIIMEKDAELEELRKFKQVAMAKEMACAVEAVMAEVRPFVSDDQFAAFRDEGLACTDGNLDAWSNKVKAACFSEVKKVVKKDEAGVLTFAMPKEPKMNKQSEDIWTRLRNQH